MRLTINGEPRLFEPIKAFRLSHDLTPEFGVALFEPKDYTGLGRIDGAGADLNAVRAAVLAAIPLGLSLRDWVVFVPELTRLFTGKLYEINPRVNLHDVEIEFAAAGFADVCQAAVYAHLRGAAPHFEQVYAEWLDQSARVSHTVHHYGAWCVQVVTYAYGRAGLVVDTGSETHYVADVSLACPAEGYMASLLSDVYERIASTVR